MSSSLKPYQRRLIRWAILLLAGLLTVITLAYLFVLVTILLGYKPMQHWTGIPALLGIPLAIAAAGLVVYIIFRIVTAQSDAVISSDSNRDNRFVYEKSHGFAVRAVIPLILVWLLCFLAIVFSIYLLLPERTASGGTRDKGTIDITFLQLNDIYEISPLDHGKVSGIARLATIRKELMAHNKNTYTLLAGDFLSPSAIGTLIDDSVAKTRIAGMHMLECLNAVGLDLAVFGNHEFDIKQEQLQKAINQSNFDWVNSNVHFSDSLGGGAFKKNGKGIPVSKVISFRNESGASVDIGIIGLTIETTGDKRIEKYHDYYQAAGEAIAELAGKCDFIVAVTHLDLQMDKELAQRFPQIKLIIGGHEHINSFDRVGNTIIAKADANIKTVYIHSLSYDVRTESLDIKSRLLVINDAIAEDPETRAVVTKWNRKAHELIKGMGINPCEVIDSIGVVLDGTEASIRTTQTNLGSLVCESIMDALHKRPDCAIFNSGSIRIDDKLTGVITAYDLLRVLPYEGKITLLKMSGPGLDSLLKNNQANERDGSFLQYAGITKTDSGYCIAGQKNSNRGKSFLVATQKYITDGKQARLEYLKGFSEPVTESYFVNGNDLQKAFLSYMKKRAVGGKITLPREGVIVPCY